MSTTLKLTHTPPPWKIGRTVSTDSPIFINGPDGEMIAPCVNTPTAEQDAAHIVRCVNEREGLLNILREAVDGWRTVNAEENPSSWYSRALVVLAKAEEEVPS